MNDEKVVLSLNIRLPGRRGSEWLIDQIKALLADEPGAELDDYGLTLASRYDAGEAETSDVEGAAV